MKKYLFLITSLTLLIVGGCSSGDQGYNGPMTEDPSALGELIVETIREFDVDPGDHGYIAVYVLEQMQDVFPHRLAFSDRELEAAEWIETTLLQMGFEESQIEIQSFDIHTPTSSWRVEGVWRVEDFEEMGYYDEVERIDTSQNVILTIPGRSEETILIGAHYDSMGNPGISDNASGIALLLESAYRMREVDHYYTLQYVFFGAEEVGLIGSFYFGDNLSQQEIDNLVLMINVDAILDGPDLIYTIGYVLGDPHETFWENLTFLTNDLTEQIDGIADDLNTSYQTELIAKPHALNMVSDHLAFLRFEIPVMAFYATHPVEYPEIFRGDVLHTPDDDLDFIMENFPGRIERALGSFGQFLEMILSSDNFYMME